MCVLCLATLLRALTDSYFSYFYKPVDVSFDSVFLCLMAYVLGVTWSVALPRREHIEKFVPSQAKWLGPVVHFINPGHFGLKEHAISSILSTSAGNGAAIVQVFGAERLYDTLSSCHPLV